MQLTLLETLGSDVLAGRPASAGRSPLLFLPSLTRFLTFSPERSQIGKGNEQLIAFTISIGRVWTKLGGFGVG